VEAALSVSVESPEPEYLQGADARAARMSAAFILGRQAAAIARILERSGGEATGQLTAHLALARAGLAAVERPTFTLDTCPDDGAPVHFDHSKGMYCCAQGCCPPGG
jgi:hypothetical protein